MDKHVLNDEWLNKAFQLAYFIHGDKAIATQIVTGAMALLEVAAAAQDKRLYYTPTGRTLARKARTKVSLSEIHLLQRLIYVESEPYERDREQADALLNEEDMITHFIKHLVKITVKRNSFYVALGLSRLLHNYTTAETQEIYNVVVQDPERVKDDYYYRSRKAQLMRELKERFADFLQCVKGHRGEEKFQTIDSAAPFATLVKDCLRMFTPWATPCLMPAQFDGYNDVLGHLSFQDTDPDEEHGVEINRLHTLLHHNCYSRLIRGIGYDSPELKLQLPQFFFATQNQGGPKGDRRNPMDLDEGELALIRGTLTAQAERRKNASAGLFRILVDGKECARFDIQERSNIQFKIEEGAELIEVRGRDDKGELLLATHLLEYDYDKAESKPFATSIVLEAGQKINFSIQPSKNSAGEMDGALVDIAYKETSMMRAIALALRQRIAWSGAGVLSAWAKPALAFALLALLAAGVWFFALRGHDFSDKPLKAEDKQQIPAPEEKRQEIPTPDPHQDLDRQQEAIKQKTPEHPSTNNEFTGTKNTPRKHAAKDLENNVAFNPKRNDSEPTNPDNSVTDDPERSTSASRIVGVPLVAVRRIAVAAYGAETLNPQIQEALVNALKATGRFDLVESGADAVLKISTKRESLLPSDNLAGATIIARLVNAKGQIIWPATTKGTGGIYQGNANEIAAKIAADILSEVQKAEQRK